jgi:DNA-directed RNA polymerase subunit RPC12/RpoP
MRRFSVVCDVCSFKRLMKLKVSGRIFRIRTTDKLRRFSTGSTQNTTDLSIVFCYVVDISTFIADCRCFLVSGVVLKSIMANHLLKEGRRGSRCYHEVTDKGA